MSLSSRGARVATLISILSVALAMLAGVAPATAQEGQGLNGVPPIIGNAPSGVLRDVPTKYYPAVDELEGRAIGEVLATHGVADTSAQREQVKAWARDEVRTQAYLDLLAIIKTPAGDRSAIDQGIYDWFQNVYQTQEIARAQGGVDEYLKWSGLTMGTIHDDPVDGGPSGAFSVGYCNYHPPAELDSGVGLFGGAYNSSGYPLCLPNFDIRLCAGNATGCPVPWPSYEQFKAWGSYRANEDLYSSPIVSVLSTEGASGIGIAATMAAAGLTVPLAARYAGEVTQGSAGLFAKVFPYAARPLQVVGEFATDAAREAAEAAALSAARISAGVTRAVSVAVVVGTIITALVTIAVETWTIIEHAAISTKLLDALDKAKNTAPDLSAVYAADGGAGALLMTFLSTTAIDVDPDCQLPTPSDPYSAFPCANAPDPAASTADDDRFYVTDASGDGSLSSSIYTINPAESFSGVVMPELTRLNDHGWFVTTKYRPTDADLITPTNPGATLQSMRLYYRGWDNETWLAERVVVGDKPMFVISSPTQQDLGGCTTKLPDGTSACLTDTLDYLAPDGTKRSAQVIGHGDEGPTVDAQVPTNAEAGMPVQVRAQANGRFPTSGVLTYTWAVPGVATPYTGTNPTVSFPLSGAQNLGLTVTDSLGGTTQQSFPVMVSGHSSISVDSPPLAAPVPYGSSPDLVVRIGLGEGQTGCGGFWQGDTFELGLCPSPHGTVSLAVDGLPLSDPRPLPDSRIGWTCSYAPPGICSLVSTHGASSTDQFHLPAMTLPLGDHTLEVSYSGDQNFAGSSTEIPFTVAKGIADVSLISGDRYPYPFGSDRVPLVARVTSPAGTAPTGHVRFVYSGQESPEDVPIDSDGTARLPANLFAVTDVSVRYMGDDLFQQSDSASYPVSVGYIADNSVTPDESTAAVGSPKTLDVTLLDDLGDPIQGVEIYADPVPFGGGNDGHATTDSEGVAHIAVSATSVSDKTYTFAVANIFSIGYQNLPHTAVVHWRDLTAPVVGEHDPVVAEATGPGGAAVTYTDPSATDELDSSPTVSCDPASGSTFALGSTTVTCGSVDDAGNHADPVQFDVTVQDTTPPSFFTPIDQVVPAGDAGAVTLTWSAISSVDLVDGAGAVTCAPSSGSSFPVGATVVFCQGSDQHGNTRTSTFNVVVLDASHPVIAAQDDLGPIEATGPQGSVVTYEAPAVYDLDDGTGTSTCMPASGSTFALGNTPVTCTHTDSAGNPAQPVQFVVTVADTTSPTVTLQSPEEGSVFAAGDTMQVALTCTDLVAVAQCLASVATGVAIPVGPVGKHEITADATDTSGNAGHASSSYVVAHGFGGFNPGRIGNAHPGTRQKITFRLLNAAGDPISRGAAARLAEARDVGIRIARGSEVSSRACHVPDSEAVFRCAFPTFASDRGSRLMVSAWERVDGTKVSSPGDGNRLVVRFEP